MIPPVASPPHNLQRVLADVFLEDTEDQQSPSSSPLPELPFPKAAPSNSLLARQARTFICSLRLLQLDMSHNSDRLLLLYSSDCDLRQLASA